MRGVQGTEQDELREPCRERCPQVSRKRDGFRGQPLEADGLGIQKGPRVSGQVVFPTRTGCLVSEADRLLISVVVSQRTTSLSRALGTVPAEAELSVRVANTREPLAEEQQCAYSSPGWRAHHPLHEHSSG